MSLDKSLKKAGSLARARNVLSRAERLALLQEDERWKPAAGVYNLPKTKYRRLAPGQSGPNVPKSVSAGKASGRSVRSGSMSTHVIPRQAIVSSDRSGFR